MSPELEENLDDLIKIPLSQQVPEVTTKLQARRKELFTIFYDRSKSAQERNAVFDEANKISNYLGEKPIKWRIPTKSAAKAPVTMDQRKQNVDEFVKYCGGTLGLQLTPESIAIVWGAP